MHEGICVRIPTSYNTGHPFVTQVLPCDRVKTGKTILQIQVEQAGLALINLNSMDFIALDKPYQKQAQEKSGEPIKTFR